MISAHTLHRKINVRTRKKGKNQKYFGEKRKTRQTAVLRRKQDGKTCVPEMLRMIRNKNREKNWKTKRKTGMT
jgi:hypothetical protein